MTHHIRRLRRDIAASWRWIFASAFVLFLVAATATYFWSFQVRDFNAGQYSSRPASEPSSFLRLASPDLSQLRIVNEPPESALTTPGMRVLLDQLASSSDIYLALPLGAVTADPSFFNQIAPSGMLLVGPGLERYGMAIPEHPAVWHDLDHGTRIGLEAKLGAKISVVEGNQGLPPALLDGRGRETTLTGGPVVLASPLDFERLGVTFPFSEADVANAVVCQCDSEALSGVANRMTDAERATGSAATYIAVPQDFVFTVGDRIDAAAGLMSVVFSACLVITAVLASTGAGHVIWRHRRAGYLAEAFCGTSKWVLLARSQTLVALAVTLPGIIGFLAVTGLLASSIEPAPWSNALVLACVAIAVVLQTMTGLGLAVNIRTIDMREVL